MNKMVLVPVIFSISLAFADIIHLKKGEEVRNAIVTEIGDNEIKYKIGERQTVYTIKKSDIASISYDDGTEDVFEPKVKEEELETEEVAKLVEESSKKPKQAEVDIAQDGIRFGVRGNIGSANVYPNVVEYQDKTKEEIPGGKCFGIGVFALIPFKSIYFVPDITLELRNPVLDYNGTTIAEKAIDVPLLFRFRYREENLIYLGIGPLFGLVLSSEYEVGKTLKGRSRSDYGMAMELGFRINENFSIDIRSTVSFAPFGIGEFLGIGGDEPTLGQSQIGVNYVF